MELKINKKYSFASDASPVQLNLLSDVQDYYISGTKTLSSNYEITTTGTAVDGMQIWLYYDGTGLTLSGNTVTVLGTLLTDKQAVLRLIAFSTYVTSAWVTRIFVDNSQTAWIEHTSLATTAVDDSSIEIDATNGLQVKALGVTNAMITAAAGIPYSKLTLTDSLLDADIKSTAQIAWTKMLDLTASKLLVSDGSGDVSVTAVTSTEAGYLSGVTSAIQTQMNTKLTTGTAALVNADVNGAAAIAYGKLALTGSVLNADINASAAIAMSKLAALTASRAVTTTAGGVLTVASVTATELGYLSGVTSAVQTQLDAAVALTGGGGGTYTKSSSATIALSSSATDYYKLDTTSNAIALTLPAASDFSQGKAITIIQVFSGGATRVTVSPAGADVLEGTAAADIASYAYTTTGEVHVFISNGTDTWIMFS